MILCKKLLKFGNCFKVFYFGSSIVFLLHVLQTSVLNLMALKSYS